ncbi:hypothetical protein, partial [Streptomyces sp. P17]|uniref:hypothetical protein n=1 Tax=Streptomyces sp. P17 TaxID=3074716 RepID=UPI0028F3EAA5
TLKEILERTAAGQGDADNPYAKAIGDLYASCTNEDAVEARGVADLRPELDRIDAVKDAASLAKVVAVRSVSTPNPRPHDALSSGIGVLAIQP